MRTISQGKSGIYVYSDPESQKITCIRYVSTREYAQIWEQAETNKVLMWKPVTITGRSKSAQQASQKQMIEKMTAAGWGQVLWEQADRYFEDVLMPENFGATVFADASGWKWIPTRREYGMSVPGHWELAVEDATIMRNYYLGCRFDRGQVDDMDDPESGFMILKDTPQGWLPIDEYMTHKTFGSPIREPQYPVPTQAVSQSGESPVETVVEPEAKPVVEPESKPEPTPKRKSQSAGGKSLVKAKVPIGSNTCKELESVGVKPRRFGRLHHRVAYVAVGVDSVVVAWKQGYKQGSDKQGEKQLQAYLASAGVTLTK